jgi:hypothetical protein
MKSIGGGRVSLIVGSQRHGVRPPPASGTGVSLNED